MQFLTCGNFGYADFLCNVVRNFEAPYMGGHRLTIACLDQDVYRFMGSYIAARAAGHITLRHCGQTGTSFFAYGTRAFSEISKLKFASIVEFATTHNEIYFFDPDVVFFRDPHPEVLKYADYDLLFQPERMQPLYHEPCTGNFVVSGSARAIEFLKRVAALFDDYPDNNDQEVLNIYLKKSGSPDLRAYATANLRILDPLLFQSGNVAFRNGNYTRSDKVCIHANWCGGLEAKRNALRKCRGWFTFPPTASP